MISQNSEKNRLGNEALRSFLSLFPIPAFLPLCIASRYYYKKYVLLSSFFLADRKYLPDCFDDLHLSRILVPMEEENG